MAAAPDDDARRTLAELEAKGVRVGRTPTEVAEIAAEIAGSLAR